MKLTKLGKLLDKWRFATEYKTDDAIPYEIIEKCFYQAWKVTPSKNNFMPYNVFVVGPENWETKEKIYQTAAYKELNSNSRNPNENAWPVNAQKYSIMSSEYTIVYTARVEDSPSKWQQYLHDGGCYMDSWYEEGIKKYMKTILVEVGMFSQNLTTFCIEQGINTNYIASFESGLEYWKDVPFVTHEPLLIMTIGKGKRFRRDDLKRSNRSSWDVKPDFHKVVKFYG